MTANVSDNIGFIECWNSILTPKWIRFRHLLSGNGKIHSDLAFPIFDVRTGDRVLDIGCGFGETSLQMAEMVGEEGEIVGIDCTESFLEIARRELERSGTHNVRYVLGDAQDYELPEGYFDVAYSRFGVMFFQSAVRALRNANRALKPGGKVCLIVWRGLSDNPCWGAAKEVALQYLPAPSENAKTCGPGPFSMADRDTDVALLGASGFPLIERFERIDADICVGLDIEEAIAYQLLVGPSGEIIREAGPDAEPQLPKIRDGLAELLTPYLRDDGVFMPSSTWAIVASKPG